MNWRVHTRRRGGIVVRHPGSESVELVTESNPINAALRFFLEHPEADEVAVQPEVRIVFVTRADAFESAGINDDGRNTGVTCAKPSQHPREGFVNTPFGSKTYPLDTAESVQADQTMPEARPAERWVPSGPQTEKEDSTF
jgi:hypothetical protein